MTRFVCRIQTTNKTVRQKKKTESWRCWKHNLSKGIYAGRRGRMKRFNYDFYRGIRQDERETGTQTRQKNYVPILMSHPEFISIRKSIFTKAQLEETNLCGKTFICFLSNHPTGWKIEWKVFGDASGEHFENKHRRRSESECVNIAPHAWLAMWFNSSGWIWKWQLNATGNSPGSNDKPRPS